MYKAVVIGGGPGGYIAAIRLAQMGAKVALVEKSRLGGTCLHEGCIPTKSYIESAKRLDMLKLFSDFGIKVEGVSLDFEKVIERKEWVVSILEKGIEYLVRQNKIEIFHGKAKIMNSNLVEIQLSEMIVSLETENIVVATGSKPLEINSFKTDGKRILNSSDILKMENLPKSMVVIGAGVIGCEIAALFNSFGVAIDMVDIANHVLPTEDEDIVQEIERTFKRKKIKLHMGVSVEKIETHDNVVITLSNGKSLEAEKVVIAIGRTPYIQGLGIEEIGIRLLKGHIAVDERFQSSVKGIYAIGDVSSEIKLAHYAIYQGKAVANVIMEKPFKMVKCVPGCVFATPELATVGVREREMPDGYRVTKHSLKSSGKALVEGDNGGIIKMIFSEDNVLKGASMVGKNANLVIHELALAIENELKAEDIIHTIHAHPTVSESVVECAEGLFGLSIH
ncbi:MAG: dihydrolipoyl dehydrogenase [Fusobacteria bacterium]|nr:dihydrolipoyl dehydrogenase [Fusobacteriota bacterium]